MEMAYMNFYKYTASSLPPINCRIVLNSERPSYNLGEKVYGKLIVSHQKDVYCFGFKVALEGRALVKYKEREILQSNSVTLLETSVYVYGSGTQRIRLSPSEHTFPFCLPLPAVSLPGSFRSPYGLILYQIVAYLCTEWRGVKKAEKTITVNPHVMIDPSSVPPVVYERTEKSLLPSLSLSRRSNPQFKFTFKLAESGFLPGEEIPFTLELENPAAHDIDIMSVLLIQKVIYHAGSSWKNTSFILAGVKTDSVDSPYGTVWMDKITVPSGPLPTYKGGLIEHQYILKVEITPVNSQVSSLKGEIPVTIGTMKARSRSLNNLCTPTEHVTPVIPFCDDDNDQTPVFEPAYYYEKLGGGPPRYSMLSLRSRSTSLASIETLPPAYEEVMANFKISRSTSATSVNEIQSHGF